MKSRKMSWLSPMESRYREKRRHDRAWFSCVPPVTAPSRDVSAIMIINLKNLRSTLNMIVDIKSFVMPYIVYSMAAGGSGLSSLRSKPVTS